MAKYKRDEVKQISRHWVKENCRGITERDLGLLKAIHKRKLLRRDQIQCLYPEFPSTDRLNKRLKHLYNKHVIDRAFPSLDPGKGSSQQHICLDKAGAILLGLERYNKPIKDVRGNKSLYMGWEHQITINQIECYLKELSNEIGIVMKLFQVEKKMEYNDTRIIPDILCLIISKNRGFLFFIEVDMNTENTKILKDKIDNYVNYYSSKVWVGEKWARLFKTPTFPRIIMLTEAGKERRKKSLQDYSKDQPLDFLVGFHEDFKTIVKSIIKE